MEPLTEAATPPTIEERIARAEHARRLLDDELLRFLLQDEERRLIVDSLHSDTVELREEARNGVRGLGRVEQRLRAWMADGEIAKATLSRRQ